MLIFFICGFILSIMPDVKCNFDYEHHSKIDGWLKLHKVDATWQEAFAQCNNEGAVLASPVTEELLTAMKTLMDTNNAMTSYYIGTHARLSPRRYVSIEGVLLEDMPVTDMYRVLHSANGECLSTDGTNINVVSCSTRLPFICYLKNEDSKKLSECGTFDKDYRLDSTTGSCYKVHSDVQTWPEAYATCIDEGGHLAILNNEEEALVVKNLWPNVTLNFSWDKKWDPLYVGLRDWLGNGNGTWLSIHGEPIDQLYNGWSMEQPDGSGQLCGALLRDGTLDNAWCHLKSVFVCEKNPNNPRISVRNQNSNDYTTQMNIIVG